MTVGFGGPGPRRVGPAVAGMPYSAEQVNETVQTLADGTHIRQKQRTTVIYRDSAGRTRMETPIGGPAMNDSARMVVDVVGGYEYTLEDQKKIAHRATIQVTQPMPKPMAAGARGVAAPQGLLVQGPLSVRAVAPGAPGSMPRPEIQSEDLGTQMIEGVTAHGHRTTQTWPVDSVGHDRRIVVVNEMWVYEQLGGVMILMKNNDARRGETTTALKNVSLAEPARRCSSRRPGTRSPTRTVRSRLRFCAPARLRRRNRNG